MVEIECVLVVDKMNLLSVYVNLGLFSLVVLFKELHSESQCIYLHSRYTDNTILIFFLIL